ncbi:putative iron-regulated protein [Phaeobacter sp. CECT 5382]|nr:putative iron-regulated protein [Phaeobacter sp. CECT 5382]
MRKLSFLVGIESALSFAKSPVASLLAPPAVSVSALLWVAGFALSVPFTLSVPTVAQAVEAATKPHDGVALGQAEVAGLAEQLAQKLSGADVIVLGEVHDNAQHHALQSQLVQVLQPSAVVWEMITQAQAETLTPELLLSSERTAQALDWDTSGWPDFALYAPVFQAAANVPHYGALVPRAASQAALQAGVASHFGADAARFGLDRPLAEAEQAEREADQLANHCNAMPAEMLPMLVDFQRLRDTSLAAVAERAFIQKGGPVVVITGNGHARTDRGLPVYLSRAAPDLVIHSLGQMEAGQISGVFDLLANAPAVDRPDSCLAFSNSK